MHWREGVESRRNTADSAFVGSREASQRSKMSAAQGNQGSRRPGILGTLSHLQKRRGRGTAASFTVVPSAFDASSVMTSLFSNR